MSDSTGHLSADTLADLQEGLLDADGEAAARRHLEACAACRADLAALTDLSALLAAAGDAGPVPELVGARLDRALAGAAAEHATDPAAATATRTVTPLAPDRGPVRGMRLLQAAAVVVLVLGAGAIGVSALNHGGSNGDSASTAGSAADSAGSAGGRSQAAPEAAAVAPITASGRDWTASPVRTDAADLLTGTLGQAYALYDRQAAKGAQLDGATPDPSASPPAAQRDLASAAGGADRLADPTALRACVANITDGDASLQPVAVGLARWQGKPAAVLVFPTADDPASLDVYVVAPDCPTGLFLDFERVPRS
jgi:anti-sigma factor RsiW